MYELPTNSTKINIEGTTTEFYKFFKDNIEFIYFDTSELPVPHPMLNAMKGLSLLNKTNKLIMLNHKIPLGLFPKIEQNFSYNIEELGNKIRIVFSLKPNKINQVDFSDYNCKG